MEAIQSVNRKKQMGRKQTESGWLRGLFICGKNDIGEIYYPYVTRLGDFVGG